MGKMRKCNKKKNPIHLMENFDENGENDLLRNHT